MRPGAKERRSHWVAELENLSGSFGNDSTKMAEELQEDIRQDGEALLDHLRFCGAIPEKYGPRFIGRKAVFEVHGCRD